jgi:hypothetical protein
MDNDSEDDSEYSSEEEESEEEEDVEADDPKAAAKEARKKRKELIKHIQNTQQILNNRKVDGKIEYLCKFRGVHGEIAHLFLALQLTLAHGTDSSREHSASVSCQSFSVFTNVQAVSCMVGMRADVSYRKLEWINGTILKEEKRTLVHAYHSKLDKGTAPTQVCC